MKIKHLVHFGELCYTVPMRHQSGHIFDTKHGWYVRFYKAGKQCSAFLCHKSDSITMHTVRQKCAAFMLKVNAEAGTLRADEDISIADFWERYMRHCEEILPLTKQPRKKPSTMRCYRQIWNQHLKAHFGKLTLQQYEARMGSQFLRSLTGTQCRTTLAHIKALGSSIFKFAVEEQHVRQNVWRDVVMPSDAIASNPTKHYTLAEAEDIISALVDRVDCQLVMALACFLGLRPGEIAALRWEDFDEESVHIRRSVVRGIVGTPKTAESIASLPLIDRVRVPLELWRRKCGGTGWVFGGEQERPLDLTHLADSVIVPILRKAGLEWKGLYAGRRGAATALINRSGNVALGQALLRHKNVQTTAQFYKKQMPQADLRAGMKFLES